MFERAYNAPFFQHFCPQRKKDMFVIQSVYAQPITKHRPTKQKKNKANKLRKSHFSPLTMKIN